MDREIRRHLEDYLHGLNPKARQVHYPVKPSGDFSSEDYAYRLTRADSETRQQVSDFVDANTLLYLLQDSPAEQFGAGFYIGIMKRIDAQRARGFWSPFNNTWFTNRLLLASTVLLALLGLSIYTLNEDGLAGTIAPALIGSDQYVGEESSRLPLASPVSTGPEPQGEFGPDQMLTQLASYPE